MTAHHLATREMNQKLGLFQPLFNMVSKINKCSKITPSKITEKIVDHVGKRLVLITF
jgi:hypothetical protein